MVMLMVVCPMTFMTANRFLVAGVYSLIASVSRFRRGAVASKRDIRELLANAHSAKEDDRHETMPLT